MPGTRPLHSPVARRAPPEPVHVHAQLVPVPAPSLVLAPGPASEQRPARQTTAVGGEGTPVGVEQALVLAAEQLFAVAAVLVAAVALGEDGAHVREGGES